MGFFSFGKKKKDVEAIGSNAAASPRTSSSKAASTPTTTTTTTAAAAAAATRPNKLVNNSGATATAGAALVPNPRRFNTHPVPSSRLAKTANVIPNANTSGSENAIVGPGEEERLKPPRPRSKLFAVAAGAGSSSSLSSSSSSLAAPIQPFVQPQQHDLSKKGSTNTLNSISSNNAGAANGTTGRRRGPHDSPKLANLSSASMKPRASSYHAATATTPTTTPSGAVRSIWMQPYQPNGSGYFGHNKYASTGTPGAGGGGGLMSRASYANLPAGAPITPIHHQPSQLQGGGGPGMTITPDEEFKAYTRTYDLLIAKAHTLARDYHHLPVAKRDREGYERVGKAFAEAARASREQWTMRCALERERMKTEGMGMGATMMSVHRLAGTRACEGWEYASMLADAWGVSEEMNVPLDEMPHQPQPHSYGPASSVPYPMEEIADVNEFGGYGYGGGGYVHPGYDRTAYAEYVAQQQQQQQQHHRGYARKRNVSVRTRLDSGVSAAAPSVLESMSTHEDGGQQQQQQRQQRSYSHSQSHHGHSGRRLSGEMVTTTAAAAATMGRSSASTGHNGYGSGSGSGSANLAGVGAGNRHRTASALSHSTSMPVLARKPAADVRAHPNGYHSGSGDEGDTPAASTGSSPASSAASYSANDNNDPPVTVAVPAAAAAAAAVHTTMTTSNSTSPVKMTFPTTTTSPPSPPPKAFPTRTVSPSPLSSSLEPAEPEVKVIKLTKGRRYRAQV
ncbi:hypothetical protein FRC17_003699 [Serendipita sp. 399]|nr:hypothetical protein FRC17_003699 [Serendipita sp. 399]